MIDLRQGGGTSVGNSGENNVNSDWAETSSAEDSFIKNKPNLFESIFFKGHTNYNNSYDLNFNHSSVISNKISISEDGKEFTFEEAGAYNIILFSAISTTEDGKKLKIVPGTGMTRQNFLLYLLDNLTQMEMWDMEIPNTANNWRKHNFVFETLPLRAGAKLKIETENAGGSGFDGGKYEYILITKVG